MYSLREHIYENKHILKVYDKKKSLKVSELSMLNSMGKKRAWKGLTSYIYWDSKTNINPTSFMCNNFPLLKTNEYNRYWILITLFWFSQFDILAMPCLGEFCCAPHTHIKVLFNYENENLHLMLISYYKFQKKNMIWE